MARTTSTIEFTFDYKLDGETVAEFDPVRATADVWPGSEPWFDPLRGIGDPGCGPEVENFRDVKVASGTYDRATKRMKYQWHEPDANLRELILDYLGTGAEDGSFMDAAEPAERDWDYLRDLRRDMDLAG